MKMFKSLLSVTLLFALFSISSSVQAHVLDGAKEWNGHYYKMIAMQMRWDNADKFCKSMGGHLATAENPEENELIKSLVVKFDKENNGGRGHGYWIGGYCDDSKIWRWVTGKAIVDYTDWIRNPSGGCMNMRSSEGGKWLSESSGWDLAFVCEWEKAEDAHDSTL